SAGGELREMSEPADWGGLFWRYLVIEDPSVTVAIFRDCDSRLSPRERAAVDEWLASDQTLDVMRDHPNHRFPIMGGLWGVRCKRARWIPRSLGIVPTKFYNADQVLLARHVWPKLKDDCIEHDEFYRGHPFPSARIGDLFVGQ